MSSDRTVKFELTPEDYRALQVYLCAPRSPRARRKTYIVVIGAAIGLLASRVLGREGLPFLVGAVFALVMNFVYMRRSQARVQARLFPKPNGYILCQHDISLDETGIVVVTPYWTGKTLWSGAFSVDQTGDHVFLRLDAPAAYAIPKAAFASQMAEEDFVSFANEQIKAAAAA